MPLPPSRKRPHGPNNQDSTEDETGSTNNVKVVVRIRPPNVKEVEGNFREVVQAVDENVLVFDPKEAPVYEYGAGRRRPRDIRQRRYKDLKFAFDRVFGPSATNTDVYNETTNTVLNGLLTGYNCSVFAYGATGAGKTHTMLGSKDHPGVMYHTMMDLYTRINNMKDNKTCDVAVSYLEVYNETIRDLLMPGAVLPIREDPGKGVMIPGLSLHKPKTAEELLYMLQFGNQHRTQHPTDANAESSRSHAVLQVFVRQQDRTANISTEVRIAKLCLVDLAGSERATVTKNHGSRFREGANINRSLLALGNVINALAENKNKGFIPYRDSKLTRLLKDSLGGNCQTVMIAAVSPSAMSYEDTYNTLRYADRAKHIKATLKKNVLNVDFHMAKYGKIVEELRKEIVELKGKLKSYEGKRMVPGKVTAQSEACTSSFVGYQNELSKFFTGHQSLRCEQLQQEIALRNLQWKMYRKQRCLSRLTTVDEPANIESLKKMEAMLSGMTQKTSCMTITSRSSRSKLVESCKHLGDLEQNIRESCGTQDKQLPEIIELSLQVHRVTSNLQDIKQHLTYTKQVVRHQEKELHLNERLIHLMLKLLKRQHYIIKGHNILTSDLAEEYHIIQQLVAGQEVCWGDQPEGSCYTRGYTLTDMLELPSLAIQPEEYTAEKTSVTHSSASQPQKPRVFVFQGAVKADQEQQQQQQMSANYPYKAVDECSPPPAKRAMLEAPKPQQQDSHVGRNGKHPPRQRNNFRYGFTPTKSRSTPTKSKSFSVAPSKTGRGNNLSDPNSAKLSTSLGNSKKSSQTLNVGVARNRKLHRRSASLGSSIDMADNEDNDDDDSSELEELTQSKFSKVNDTITKSKKFSHLDVNSDTGLRKNTLQTATIPEEGTADLDSTFTMDPRVNSVPVSKIPCVDCVGEKSCRKCDQARTGFSKSVITSESVEKTGSCQNCGKDDEIRIHQPGRRLSNTSFLGISFTNSSGTNPDSCKCDKLEVEPAQKYTSCVDNLQTGSQDYGPENESGTSTIVNQSSNSVTSLASVSTLVESQNLSQNLSQTDEQVFYSSENTSVSSTSTQGKDKRTKSYEINSGTVTKSSKTLGVAGIKHASSVPDLTSEKSHKAVRSIQFDNDENGQTPSKGKSYADIVQTPTPERRPLRPLGSSNTPQSSSTRHERSSGPSTDSDMSFDKRSSSEKTQETPEELKENKRILNKYGLPSLLGESIILNTKKAMAKQQSFTPGYMQTTKSHMNRKKLNISKNSSLNSSSEDAVKSDSIGNSLKTSFISKHGRSLGSHNRSKSVSNLSSRASWQI